MNYPDKTSELVGVPVDQGPLGDQGRVMQGGNRGPGEQGPGEPGFRGSEAGDRPALGHTLRECNGGSIDREVVC